MANRPTSSGPSSVSAASVFLIAVFATVVAVGSIGAGYWFLVKPQVSSTSQALVSLEIQSQELTTQVGSISERLGVMDGGDLGSGGSNTEVLTRLAALEEAAKADADALNNLRTEVLEPLIAKLRDMTDGMTAAPAPANGRAQLPTGLLDQAATVIIPFKKVGDTGGSWLGPFLEKARDDIRKEVDGRTGCVLHISGHADRLGPSEVNERIGFRRAERVRDGLSSYFQGDADLEKLVLKPSVSLGERDLAINTEDNVANPKNRRVEIRVVCPVKEMGTAGA